MQPSDGHGPATCNYRYCNGSQYTPCPYLADENPPRTKDNPTISSDIVRKAELFDELQDLLKRILEH